MSFAGEDRPFVDQLATILKDNGISVFYDKFEEVDLWGKDLGVHFDYIYRRASKYFIPFISDAYKEKIWTNHEVRTAIARSIENIEEYILPVKFDDTELDGIRSTIGALDARKNTPIEIAEKIMLKLKKDVNVPLPQKNEEKLSGVYLSANILIPQFGSKMDFCVGISVTNLIKENRYFNAPIFKISRPLVGELDTFQLIDSLEQLEFPVKLEYGQRYTINYQLKSRFLDDLYKFYEQGVTIQAFVNSTVGEQLVSNTLSIDDFFKFKN